MAQLLEPARLAEIAPFGLEDVKRVLEFMHEHNIVFWDNFVSAGSGLARPEEMLRLLNDSLQERRVDAQYVTMVYAVWNDLDQTLEIANAGAVQPLILRSGEVETIAAEGFPLGLFPDVTYEQFTLSTRPGDAVIFFSDGLAEEIINRNKGGIAIK